MKIRISFWDGEEIKRIAETKLGFRKDGKPGANASMLLREANEWAEQHGGGESVVMLIMPDDA